MDGWMDGWMDSELNINLKFQTGTSKIFLRWLTYKKVWESLN